MMDSVIPVIKHIVEKIYEKIHRNDTILGSPPENITKIIITTKVFGRFSAKRARNPLK
jgi:hypothetical protein